MNFYAFPAFVLYLSSVVESGQVVENVTYGSVLKLINVEYKARLHSHDVKYGSGSGQQSVTATLVPEDVNSHWLVKGIQGGRQVNRGDIVRCGDVIRLEHIGTKKNLHSHNNFRSPLSALQEVSCYGENGIGDSGDVWIVECLGTHWSRNSKVNLRHAETSMYLCTSRHTYGRPINGQHEVFGAKTKESCASEWRAAEGIYIGASELNIDKLYGRSHDPSEL